MLAMVAWFLVEGVLVGEGKRTSGCALCRSRMTRERILRLRQEWQVSIEWRSQRSYRLRSGARRQQELVTFFFSASELAQSKLRNFEPSDGVSRILVLIQYNMFWPIHRIY